VWVSSHLSVNSLVLAVCALSVVVVIVLTWIAVSRCRAAAADRQSNLEDKTTRSLTKSNSYKSSPSGMLPATHTQVTALLSVVQSKCGALCHKRHIPRMNQRQRMAETRLSVHVYGTPCHAVQFLLAIVILSVCLSVCHAGLGFCRASGLKRFKPAKTWFKPAKT